jgi:hypothetical protein
MSEPNWNRFYDKVIDWLIYAFIFILTQHFLTADLPYVTKKKVSLTVRYDAYVRRTAIKLFF